MNIVEAIPFLQKHPIYTAGDEAHPAPIHLNELNDSKFIILTGDNATGKSYFSKMLSSWMAKHENTSPILLSMINRTSSGVNSSAITRAFIYGDQSEQSTGETSVNVVRKAFSSISKRDEDKEQKQSIIVLDEPDMGLSEGYQYALGQYIAQEYKKVKDLESFSGILLVTHSKNLIKGLIELDITPSYINSGEPKIKLEEWLNRVEKKSVEDLLSLKDKANSTRCKIYRIEEEVKKMNRKNAS